MDAIRPLTAEERAKAIASLLARGVIRARDARQAAAKLAAPESYPQSQIPLELSVETRLSVATGSGG